MDDWATELNKRNMKYLIKRVKVDKKILLYAFLFIFVGYTVELQRLEHLRNHGNIF